MTRKKARERLSAARERKQRQVRGTRRRARSLVGSISLSDFFVTAPKKIIKWFLLQVPRAFGSGTPKQQVTASISLIGFSISTSLFTGGATLVFVGLFAVTMLLGLVRVVPAVNSGWTSSRNRTKGAAKQAAREGKRWGRR